MYRDRKVVVVMPAYNAAQTLRKTYEEVMAQGIVDLVVLVDDASHDDTPAIAATLPKTKVKVHDHNKGYGANQKTCYETAIAEGADIVIMVHPDYQYTPHLIPAMAALIGGGLYHCVLGSRILGGYALRGGMPLWRYAANRFLTFVENIFMGAKLSEYHTGYRAFSRQLLEGLALEGTSDDFAFDNEMLAKIIWQGYTVAEVSCPTKYFTAASSINFRRSVRYGFACLFTAFTFRLAKMSLVSSKLFPEARLMTGIRAFDELFSDRGYISLKNYLYNYLIRRHAVRKILRDKRQERILEVGSGISPMTAAREFPLVVYSDVSFSCLHILKGSGAGGVYAAADGAGLPFRDGAFAAVVCSEVLEHVEDDAQALQEIARVLRPEGTLVVTFPHRKFYFSRDDRFVHHYRRYEGKEMEDLMQQAGLRPVFTRKLLGPLEKVTMMIAVSVFSALKTIKPEFTEGSAGRGLPRFLEILFVVVNRFYAGLAWLDGQLSPRCLASVLLIKAVKTH